MQFGIPFRFEFELNFQNHDFVNENVKKVPTNKQCQKRVTRKLLRKYKIFM